ncbi:MAG: hypothetical protein IRY85_18070, partial [Micromonosporaceae bacterium]|nr:hypothetical protein [Micromonosporaceae bacterium]
TTDKVDLQGANHVAYWWEGGSLVWVGAFAGLVLGRLVLARVLALVGLAHAFGLTALIVASTLKPTWWSGTILPYEQSTMHQAWFCLTVVAVFLVPRDFRPPRAWLAAYLVPAAVLVPATMMATAAIVRAAAYSSTNPATPPEWVRHLDLVSVGTILHLGVIVGMAVALVWARRWLFPLAAFGGAVAIVQLLGYYYGAGAYGYEWWVPGSALWTGTNVVQLLLAGACVVAGFLAVRRARRADGPSDAATAS